jgi:hypothetical protein
MSKLPSGLTLSFEKDPSWQDRDFIDEGLGAYNAPFLRDSRYSYFGVFVREAAATASDGAIRAGLIGNCYAGWLFIQPAVGACRSAAQRHRQPPDQHRRGPCRGMRLSLRVGRYVLVPGAEFLSAIGLPRVCPARLPAGPPAHLSAKTTYCGMILWQCFWQARAGAARSASCATGMPVTGAAICSIRRKSAGPGGMEFILSTAPTQHRGLWIA